MGKKQLSTPIKLLPVLTLAVIVGFSLNAAVGLASPTSPQDKVMVSAAKGGSGGSAKPPLGLWNNANQISPAGYGNRVRVFDFNGQTYVQSWLSKPEWQYKAAWIGDSDNDGSDELVALALSRSEGLRLYVFESGSTGEPSWKSNPLGVGNRIVSLMVADADNDGKKDIAMTLWDRVEVWKYNSTTASYYKFWQGPTEEPKILAIDVGDANNDVLNDIVVGTYGGTGYFVAYPFNPSTGLWDRVVSASFGPLATLEGLAVRDVDGDLKNEVIGGTDNRLVIWEEVGGAYQVSYASDQIGFTPGVDAADFDSDGKFEIVVVASKGVDSQVYVFKYNGTTYAPVWSGLTGITMDTVRAGDSDNDGVQEFVLGTIRGIRVYEYNSATQGYENVYTNEWGDEIEWISIK